MLEILKARSAEQGELRLEMHEAVDVNRGRAIEQSSAILACETIDLGLFLALSSRQGEGIAGEKQPTS